VLVHAYIQNRLSEYQLRKDLSYLAIYAYALLKCTEVSYVARLNVCTAIYIVNRKSMEHLVFTMSRVRKTCHVLEVRLSQQRVIRDLSTSNLATPPTSTATNYSMRLFS
jgi:predicted aminopeptidase